jgi:hypothetical protein
VLTAYRDRSFGVHELARSDRQSWAGVRGSRVGSQEPTAVSR